MVLERVVELGKIIVVGISCNDLVLYSVVSHYFMV